MMKKRATKSQTKRNLKSKAKAKTSPKKKASRKAPAQKSEVNKDTATSAPEAPQANEPAVQGPVGTEVIPPTSLDQPTQV